MAEGSVCQGPGNVRIRGDPLDDRPSRWVGAGRVQSGPCHPKTERITTAMYFPISGVHLDPVYLVFIGFVIGVLGGFFGVGGSFLTAPALFAAGLPMNYVVGTDLAHIVGKSIVAARTHRVLGNIDMKLAVIMVIGTIAGSETGVQAIEILKRGAHVALGVGPVSIVVFTGISLFCAWESWMALRLNQRADPKANRKHDVTAIDSFSKALQRIKL